jgi:glycosyltransferase involved in cell wall biosynthesis
MKVLLVSNAINGGAGKACHRLYQSLRAQDVDARMLYLDGRSPHDPNVISLYGNVRDLFLRQLLFLPRTRFDSLLAGDARHRYRLPSSIHRMEKHPLIGWADLINLHWVPDFVDYKRFFQAVSDKPVVWTMHDMLPFSGGYHYETDLANRDPRVEQRIEAYKTRVINGARLGIVAPSSWLLRVSQRHATFQGRLHQHIFNGLQLEIYKPMEKASAREVFNLPPNKKTILFIADSIESKRKGMKYLTEALDRLDQRDLVLISVGRGSVELDSKFDHYHLGSLTDDVAMSICYSCADLVIVPSIEDNSPNIIIESFSCGRPVIGFDVGGISELISDPGLGLLVPELDSEALSDRIGVGLDTEFDVDFIRSYAVEHFSFSTLASNYLNVFEQVQSL